MNKPLRDALQTGDLLEEVHRFSSPVIWRVNSVIDWNGISHVRLSLVTDPTVTKTLALNVLLRGGDFKRRDHLSSMTGP